MNTKQRILGVPAAVVLAFVILLSLSGLAFTAAPAAAADQPVLPQPEEINWTSDVPLCAPGFNPNNEHCGADSAEWPGYTAPSDGMVTLEICAVHYHTDDGNEFLDYTTSWGAQGFVHASEGGNDCNDYTIEVSAGQSLSVSFTHPPTGGKGGSVKAGVYGHYEPTPPPPPGQPTGAFQADCEIATAWVAVDAGHTGVYEIQVHVDETKVMKEEGDLGLGERKDFALNWNLQADVTVRYLVIVQTDDGETYRDEGSLSLECAPPPVETFEVQIGASCENHVLRGWVRGSASQEATLSVTASALNAEIGGRRQVGPGVFEFSAEKGGFEGLVAVEATATLTYESELVDEAEFSATLDCGTTPAPEPGVCVAATVSVANVPDEGAMVTVSAQAVGVQAVISVNGLQMGNAVPIINGAATFNVFVKPKDKIVVAVQGEDGAWSTTPACQLTIAGEPERCPSSFVTAYVYYDESRNGLWEAGNSIPALGTLDWQSAGEAGLNGVSVVVPTDFGSFSGTTQPNGWAFTSAFYSTTFFAQPIGGYASDGSPMPFMVNGEAWSLTGVATLATDGTGIQTPVNTWPLEEGGHCGARVFLVGLAPAALTAEVAQEAPAWGLDAPTGEMVWSDYHVGQVVFDNGCSYAIIEVAGSATSQWDKGGLRRDRNLIGLHNMVGQTGCANPGAQVQNFAENGGTVTVTLDGVTNVYTRGSAGFASKGATWESRLENIATGEGLTLFTCDGYDSMSGDFAGYQVVSLSPAG